ncbi:MAG TPA: helix-hairpin-helix domain-containing protein [Bacteroidia bacterium]|nr:helix-hairpin-helix domain-containing protein [Bacteroidia bacterium]
MSFKFFRSTLASYFTFTTRERRGAFWLLLIVAIEISWLYYDSFIRTPDEIDLSDFQATIVQMNQKKIQNPHSGFDSKKNGIVKPDSLFEFDPNTADAIKLQLLGLSGKQASAVMHYREKGGNFKKKEDFSKIYVIGDDLYRKLEPYIRIQAKNEVPVQHLNRKSYQKEKTELNSATEPQLEALPYIGPTLANRIIRYRDALGGFISTAQLLEVYGIDSSAYKVLSNLVTVNGLLIHTININSDSLRHPYLSYKLVKVLAAYRQSHGNFKRPEDIRNVALIKEEIYLKIAPYLAVE